MSGNKGDKRIYSTLICNVCGQRMQIPRRRHSIRPEGHIKTMYCGICGEIRDFTENNYISLAEKENSK